MQKEPSVTVLQNEISWIVKTCLQLIVGLTLAPEITPVVNFGNEAVSFDE